MAERKEIRVRGEVRTGRGKNDARRLRARGFVPMTIYGGEGESVSVAAPLKDLATILRSDTGHNTIFTLDVDGVGTNEVMFLDRQIDSMHGRLMHADLRRLVRGQKVEVTVPLHLTGEPKGIKEEGGVLEQIVREINISCRPRSIPDAINVDVSHLGVHDVLHVSDIPKDEDMDILDAPDMVLATVGIIREEEEATPVVEAPAEPEVIGKGKKDEEGEGK
ncbi:MAG: 50S ribosomal protein L25/general stress protein Ctc [Pyrinomonadaceae bacterium]